MRWATRKINRLRSMTQAALGSRYDLRSFNDTVLMGGNVPLDVLAVNIEDYIRRMRPDGVGHPH